MEISLTYLELWLRCLDCVLIFSLMEDAATTEISRAQLWQWNRHKVKTDDDVLIDTEYIRITLNGLLEAKQAEFGTVAYGRPSLRDGMLLITFVQGPFRSF